MCTYSKVVIAIKNRDGIPYFNFVELIFTKGISYGIRKNNKKKNRIFNISFPEERAIEDKTINYKTPQQTA